MSQVCEIVWLLQLSDLLSDPMLFNDKLRLASVFPFLVFFLLFLLSLFIINIKFNTGY